MAVDANVVLSTAIGGKAIKVFLYSSGYKFVTVANVIDEIKEYLPHLFFVGTGDKFE